MWKFIIDTMFDNTNGSSVVTTTVTKVNGKLVEQSYGLETGTSKQGKINYVEMLKRTYFKL